MSMKKRRQQAAEAASLENQNEEICKMFKKQKIADEVGQIQAEKLFTPITKRMKKKSDQITGSTKKKSGLHSAPNVVLGSIRAGNTSVKLRKGVASLLSAMTKAGVLNELQRQQILKDYNID